MRYNIGYINNHNYETWLYLWDIGDKYSFLCHIFILKYNKVVFFSLEIKWASLKGLKNGAQIIKIVFICSYFHVANYLLFSQLLTEMF